MENSSTEDTSRFDSLPEKSTFIEKKYGESYPIILYEPSIHCQEKKALKDLIQNNKSIDLFDDLKEASKFVQYLDISFILIFSQSLDEKNVLQDFKSLENIYCREMIDDEEEPDLFQSLPENFRKSLKLKAYVFVTLEDLLNDAPMKENEEEAMILSSLKKMAEKFRQEYDVIWYDPCRSAVKETSKEKFDIEERNIYDDFGELEKRIHKPGDPAFHLILTGKAEAKKILDQINELGNSLLSLCIYCDDPDIKSLARGTIYVEKTLEDLVPKITEGIRTGSKSSNSLPAFGTAFDASDKNDTYKLHYYLQGFLTFRNRKQARRDFLQLGKWIYESKKLLRFEKEYIEYNREEIFKWYAAESPVYKLVNNCLRDATPGSILYSRFILRDLERAIKEEYQEKSHQFSGVVYRGTCLSPDELEKLQRNIGKEIEMYGFLSTSQNLQIAKNYASKYPQNGILITVIIPPLSPELNKQGFAGLSKDSQFDEAEILFNVRSKFLILEVGMTEPNASGKKYHHLVLLYGAQLLRQEMTEKKPVVSFELQLPSEVKCGLCGSAKELFAFQQGMTEVRCIDCLIKSSVPQDVPLLALNFEKNMKGNEVVAKSFKGQLLAFKQPKELPYHGYKCYHCQEEGKKKYYKWINLDTKKGFEQCSDCFEKKRKIESHILVAETFPYGIWQEEQPEWEAIDAKYQTEAAKFMKDKDQGDVYLDVKEFDLAMEYERKLLNKYKMVRRKEWLKRAIFQRMGKASQGSGKYQKAFEFYSIVVDISKLRGEERNLAASYDSLASACRDLGQYKEALEYWTKSLNIFLRIHGDNHPETAIAFNNIAMANQDLGQHQKTLEYFAKALEIRKAACGKEDPETATSYDNYASAWKALGNYKEALKYHETALSIRKAVFGDKHPDTASSYDNCAAALNGLGEYPKAHKYYTKALNLRKAILPEMHPDVALSYNSFAKVCREQKKYEEALEYSTKVLDIRKCVFGDNHHMTACSYSNCAVIYNDLQQSQKAFKFNKKALEIRKATLGDKHPETAHSLRCLAFSCQRFGRYQEGLEYSKEALKIFLDSYGEKHPETAVSFHRHASSCWGSGQYREALKSIAKAVEISKYVFGEKHPETTRYLNDENLLVMMSQGISSNPIGKGI